MSADFSEEIENRTVSEIVHDCQSSVTQYFVNVILRFFTCVTIIEIHLLLPWLHVK